MFEMNEAPVCDTIMNVQLRQIFTVLAQSKKVTLFGLMLLFGHLSFGQLTRLYYENLEWKKEIQAFIFPDLNLMVDTSNKVYDLEGNLLFNPPNPRPVILFELWKKEILVISILSDDYVSSWFDYENGKFNIVIIDLSNRQKIYNAKLDGCYISDIDLQNLTISCTDYRKTKFFVKQIIEH